MAVSAKHFHLFEKIFSIDGVIRSPTLIFGFQEIRMGSAASAGLQISADQSRPSIAQAFDGHLPFSSTAFHGCTHLGESLQKLGVTDVDCIDLYDRRANLIHDMNTPLPEELNGKYQTLIDIGSLEHVFDTKQCLTNYFNAIAVGGHLVLHTPVNGFFGHGLKVFNPETITLSLTANGFDILCKFYTDADGCLESRADSPGDIIMWLAARKRSNMDTFVCPQQSYWVDYYGKENFDERQALQAKYWADVAK